VAGLGDEIEPLVVALGEVFVKISGERHYLCPAVDHEGEAINEQTRLDLWDKLGKLHPLGGDSSMRRNSLATTVCFLAAVAHFATAEAALGIGGDWTTATPLPDKRAEVSVTTDGERIYLLGGFGLSIEGRASAPRAVYGYDPDEDGWLHITDLPEGVNHAGLANFEGSLYIVGGFRESSFDAIDNLRIYDLDRHIWRDGPPMPTARGALAVAVHDGRLHAMGGTDENSENSGAHEIFDMASETWTVAAALPIPRNHFGAASVDGKIVVLGGRDETSAKLTHNHIYDNATGEWREGAPLPTGRSGVAAVELDGYVYLFGGETFDPGSTFDDTERYRPASDRWEVLPQMPTPRHGLGAAVLNGRIHVISGGPEAGLSVSNVHEVLTPLD